MVTRYVQNMIVFLRCHYAYLLITITSKLSAFNHNKILYYCNCHATISSSVHTFASFFSSSCKNKLHHYRPVVLKLFCMFYPFNKDDYQIYPQCIKWCSFIKKLKKQFTSVIINATDDLAF